MISVTTLSRGYSSLWSQVTPWLSGYVSYINQGGLKRVETPIESNDAPSFRAINNSVAFYQFFNVVHYQINLNDFDAAIDKAITHLYHLPRNNIENYVLSDENSSVIQAQVARMMSRYSDVNPILHPQFPGCGIILNAEGDFKYNQTLVEIKAGERDIYPSDIKQLIVYGALNSIASDSHYIDHFELYNPRQGMLYREDVKTLGLLISDRSTEEIYAAICDFAEHHGFHSN